MRRELAIALALSLVAGAASAQIAVRGERVHTVSGDVLEDAVVVCTDGRITAVGPAAEVAIPDGYRVLEAAVVTPGLVDAHSVVGLAGWLNDDHDQDQLDRNAPVQPELRAIDAYNPREPLIEWVRSLGVTTLHTGHAPGALVSGQTMVVKTRGNSVEDAVLVPYCMLAATFGDGATVDGRRAPGTRARAVSMLRERFIAAAEYAEGRAAEDESARPARDLAKEALAKVLAREVPLLVTVHRAHDIVTALRFADEFGIRLVLDGASEAYLETDRIREAGASVIVHPTMLRASREAENLSMETPAALRAAGIPVAFQSGYESYVPKTRVVLFEAAVALRYGLSFDDALAMITLDAARLIGVDDRVGSLDVGKDADLALYDGDPFEYTTHCTAVVIEGEVVSEVVR